MRLQIDSGYIGSEAKWIEFFKRIMQLDRSQILEYVDNEKILEDMFSLINSILDNYPDKRDFYLSQVSEYPFDVPQSLKDMWLSGSVDVMEVIMSYTSGYPIQNFTAGNGLKYHKNFIYPKSVFKYKDSEKVADFPLNEYYVKEYLEEPFEDPNTCEYFEYPNDPFLALPAYSKDSLLNSFILAEGDGLEVDGGILLMYTDISFQPLEHEVALFSLPESSVHRFQSIAEFFLVWVLHPLFFDQEAHSRRDLVRIDPVYQLLLKA